MSAKSNLPVTDANDDVTTTLLTPALAAALSTRAVPPTAGFTTISSVTFTCVTSGIGLATWITAQQPSHALYDVKNYSRFSEV